MGILDTLKRLYKSKTINKQQYKTYKGQVMSGNALGCVTGLMRKHLIEGEEADTLILLLAGKE